MHIAFFGWLKLLNVYFPQRGQAYYCLANARPFPIQQFGSPALTILSWWLARMGWQFTHAAVVGRARGGILLGGYGGAGKSTLAFSILGSELRYLSDDYCVLIPAQPTQAVALFNSGKLTEASLNLLPHLRSRMANGGDAAREKAVFFLHEQFPGRQLLRAPLRAIVVPEVHPRETSLHPIPGGGVHQIIARSTLEQLAGTGWPDLTRLLRLLVSLPTYRLRHGSDFAATHRLLLPLCES
jgi:hypothetical protein